MSSVSSYDDNHGDTKHDAQPTEQPSLIIDRRSTVYDAVAGRLTNDRFIRSKDFIPSTRDTTSSSHINLPPGEALFRSSGAPTHYIESGIYDQEHTLTKDEILPAPDLLKAIHSYSADFYAKTADAQADLSYQSLDGSALLALGILLEESCNVMLGGTGDLALLEEKIADEVSKDSSQAPNISSQTQDDESEPPAKKRKVGASTT